MDCMYSVFEPSSLTQIEMNDACEKLKRALCSVTEAEVDKYIKKRSLIQYEQRLRDQAANFLGIKSLRARH